MSKKPRTASQKNLSRQAAKTSKAKVQRKSSRKSIQKPEVPEVQVETELTPAQQRFLAAISLMANITVAAELAQVDRSIHYHWLQQLPYQKAFIQAREAAIDRLEEEAWKRAKGGSDRLLMFLLSSYRARFRVDYMPGGPVHHEWAMMDEDTLLAESQKELQQLGYDSLEQLWVSGAGGDSGNE